MTLSSRRQAATAATIAIAVGLVWWQRVRISALRPAAAESGLALFGVVLLLAFYGVRKRIAVVPLGSAAGWLQVHIYAAYLSIVLFLLHTGGRVPGGLLEGALALLFVLVAASGLLGLALSRTLPSRLASRGEEVLFERIPAFRRELREQAEAMIAKTGSAVLTGFHSDRLAWFLAAPRNGWRHVVQSTRPVGELIERLEDLRRYLDDEEGRVALELAMIIRKKDDLDYHYALQRLLRGWLLVHAPLTWALLPLAMAHAVLANAFAGGAP